MTKIKKHYEKKRIDKKTKGVMEESDYNQAKVYGERAKQKYLAEKAKKNSNEVPNA